MNAVKTEKGTILPLVKLKGKDYLQVAHRLMWFNERSERFTIETEFLLLTEDETIAKATVSLFDENRNLVKKTTATKRETKKDFPDHTEKAETGSVGRALAMMGFGTQFAIADLDEGDRLADAPVVNPKDVVKPVEPVVANKPEPVVAKKPEPVPEKKVEVKDVKQQPVTEAERLADEPMPEQPKSTFKKPSSFKKPSDSKPKPSWG